MKKMDNMAAEALRARLAEHAKGFKISWVHLGQGLYAVWRDKLFIGWGFDKFEDYAAAELGIKKPLAMKLVKTYFFVEQEEPAYLKKDFSEAREATVVPGYESLDVLRLARRNSQVNREDYVKLRKQVFEKGRDAAAVRKDLTAIIKERKQVNPDEEREARQQASIRRFVNALKSFQKDAETLQLVENDIADEAGRLLARLEEKYL